MIGNDGCGGGDVIEALFNPDDDWYGGSLRQSMANDFMLAMIDSSADIALGVLTKVDVVEILTKRAYSLADEWHETGRPRKRY